MNKKNKLLPIPRFQTEDQERDFWAKADTSRYFDWSKTKHVSFPNLKFSTETISLRLTKSMLDDLKIAANRRDVPYQSLIKIYLDQALRSELYK
jgi:predicted DNA binding CopG/RHH family protein